MKQFLLAISILAAAFLVACADSKSKLSPRANGVSSAKTLEQLEKASSDEELSKMKKQLESNKKLHASDVIRAVNAKFGNKNVGLKSKKKGDKKVQQKISVFDMDKDPSEQQEARAVQNELLQGVAVRDENGDADKIITLKDNEVETKNVCINTCDIQIVVERIMNEKGALVALKAYVVVKASGFEHIDDGVNDKKVQSLIATYGDNQMIFKISVKQGEKIINVTTDAFTYAMNKLPSGVFSDKNGLIEGKYDIKIVDGVTAIRLVFDKVMATKFDDLGLFKNKSSNPSSSNVDGTH